LSFDLADLRGYHYHSGVVFAAYCAGSPGPWRWAAAMTISAAPLAAPDRQPAFPWTCVNCAPVAGWRAARRDSRPLARGRCHARRGLRLRAQGERVVLALPGHDGTWREAGCDRILVRSGDNWIIESLKED
jgi:ATP phosphoribosyltransferase regulatory subunit